MAIAPKVRKAVAILIGLALSGTAAAIVHALLGAYVEREGLDELTISARRVIALTEARLDNVTDALEQLTRREVRSCADADREVMNEIAFRVAPVKEVSIVDADGRTRCTNLAIAFDQRQVVSQPISNAGSDVVIEVVQLGEHLENAIRVRRATGDGLWLAALLPVELLLPRISRTGGPAVVNAALVSRDGITIGERTAAGRAAGDDSLVVRLPSERFGLEVSTSLPRGAVHAAQDGMVRVVTIGTGAAAALILALLASGPLRPRKDPAAELARAIRAGELVPYYQPIVDLNSARIVSAEVLVRWRRPDGALVPPVQFIPLAEQSGLIMPLTHALMRRVCAEAGEAIGARPWFQLGFNLSARHFADETIVRDVGAIFGPSPIALDQVLLEVTERQALENLGVARRVIAALQGIGVHVGIDDLGTGHSGLSYMLKLGVDFIKIDKMFVDSIDTERYSGTIIETLVSLAHDMKMEIIAEGVETFEQVRQLRERGIGKAQGYVFAPPLPGPSFLTLLAASDAAAPADAPAATVPAPLAKVA